MRAYVINLDSRNDRWAAASAQFQGQGYEFHRVRAIDSGDVAETTHVTRPVAACWESHRLAMGTFLQTDDEAALVLEDDFALKRSAPLDHWGEFFIGSTLDFLQIGYLRPNLREKVAVAGANAEDRVYRLAAAVGRIPGLTELSGARFAREKSAFPEVVVLDDVRAGAHAYFVNRRMATALLTLNDPVFLAVDDLYIALARMRTFFMGRTRTSKVDQVGSLTSSIDKRFVR